MVNDNQSIDENRISRRYYFSSGRIFRALLLIAIGTIFLLNNFGILPWSVWTIVWRFWPVILIIIGLQIIFGGIPFAGLIISLIGAGIIGLILAFSVASVNQNFDQWLTAKLPRLQRWEHLFPGTFRSNSQHNESIVISGDNFPNIEKRTIKMDLGAGKFTINDSKDPDFFRLEAQYLGEIGKPVVKTTPLGNELTIEVNTKENLNGLINQDNKLNYIATVGKPSLKTNLNISLGAGSLDSDFQNVAIDTLKLDVGAGSTTIQLGDASIPESGDINIGAGSLKIKVPKNSGLKIHYSVGLGQLKAADQVMHGNGTFTSDNYGLAAKRFELSLKVGAGEAVFDYK